jgi:phage tail-like protein
MNALAPSLMPSAFRTPRVPEPPHDPTSLLLNSQVGWRGRPFTDLVMDTDDGALMLPISADDQRQLTEPSGSFGGLCPPTNVAIGPDGSVYLLDATKLALKRFDPCTCAFEIVPCIGGEGGEGRQWRNAHGIAICGANVFVCDTGLADVTADDPCVDITALRARLRAENHRVSVFALKGFALRGHLRPPRSHYPYWEPFAVACDSRRRIFVTDAANDVVHRFDPGGRWEEVLSGFSAPTHIAIDCRDRLYVVVNAPTPAVRLVEGLSAQLIDAKTDPTSLRPFFRPLPFDVEPSGVIDLSAQCPPPQSDCGVPPTPQPGRGRFDAHGDPLDPLAPALPAPQFASSGTYTSVALDSKTYHCQWHRVILHGTIPTGTQLVVRTFSADEAYTDDQIDLLADWRTDQAARGSIDDAWDCLVRSGPGRYLWLRLELKSNGVATPKLDAAEIEFPRVGSIRYLPAVFGAEPVSCDFTERFLALFDTTLSGTERTIDTEARFFDPLSAPAERDGRAPGDFLTWIAGWIGIAFDRNWDIAKRRHFLKHVGALLDRRGTLEGLRAQLLMLLGFDRIQPCCEYAEPTETCRCEPVNCAPRPKAKPWQPPPLVLEHFRLRRWLFIGGGALGNEAMLWGASIVNRSQLDENAAVGRSQLLTAPDPLHDPFRAYAFQFTVFVPSRYRDSEQQRKGLENLLRAESPAHTRFNLRFVEPRFRIGMQSMIGFDTVIGCVPQGVTLGEGALGEATVLTSPPHLQGGPAMALGKEGRIGLTTQLS